MRFDVVSLCKPLRVSNGNAQFATAHGWKHFFRCLKAVVDILDFWRQHGVMVEVMDEGDFWETRSEEKLRTVLQKYDGLVAAVAGVLKDAGKSVESPVFEWKDFEWLETAGQQEFKRPAYAPTGAFPLTSRRAK